MQEWLKESGKTVIIVFEGKDSDGEALPNGTRLDLYVDTVPKITTDEETNGLNQFLQLKNPVQTGENQFILYENDSNTENVFDIITDKNKIILKGEIIDGDAKLSVTYEYDIVNIIQSYIPDETDVTKQIKIKTVVFNHLSKS
jgi:hypothetical protein